jgi:hypothetical protein
VPGGFVFDGIGAIHPFEFNESGSCEGVERVESIGMVGAFGVNGISETGVARHGVCTVMFWEGSGEEKKVFEVCEGRD